jgi:hypothetical protein
MRRIKTLYVIVELYGCVNMPRMRDLIRTSRGVFQ